MWSRTLAWIWLAGIHCPYHLAFGASAIFASSFFFAPFAFWYGVHAWSPEPL